MARQKARMGRLAIITAIAMLGALWTAGPAFAAESTGDNIPGGEAEFKRDCALGGGTFKRDGKTGTLLCAYKDGTMILCDRGATNCSVFKPKPTRWSPIGHPGTQDTSGTGSRNNAG